MPTAPFLTNGVTGSTDPLRGPGAEPLAFP